jgi:hypothetical protein
MFSIVLGYNVLQKLMARTNMCCYFLLKMTKVDDDRV